MSSLASASVTSLAPFDPSLSLSRSLLSSVGARLAKLALLLLAPSPFSFLSSLSVLELLSLTSFLPTRLCTLRKSDGRSVPP